MSGGDVPKVSPKDLQLIMYKLYQNPITELDLAWVQNLIERCLQLYMTQKEAVCTLQHQAKIEPSFTELVWQKLEEENQDFFKAYHLRLILKDQIQKFNNLLETQAQLMSQLSTASAPASVPIPNGSHANLYNTGQAMKLDNMNQSTVSKLLPSGLTNGGPSAQNCMQSGVNMSGLARRDDVSSNLLMVQNPNMGLMQGMNSEGMIKPESGYAEPSFMYNSANNVVERRVPVPSFMGEEGNPKPGNESVVDLDTSSFGFLGQIPRNFSLSDLSVDFSISSDILDNYSRSPYLAADTDFLNPHGNGDIQGDGKRLDTISEGLSYEGFGSD